MLIKKNLIVFGLVEEGRLRGRVRLLCRRGERLLVAGNAVGALAVEYAPGCLFMALVAPNRGIDSVECVVLWHGSLGGGAAEHWAAPARALNLASPSWSRRGLVKVLMSWRFGIVCHFCQNVGAFQ